MIQGIGHGDLIQDSYGKWHILSLGFRQIHQWQAYYTLGREVFLTPVSFDTAGWFTAGKDGTTDFYYEMDGDFEQLPLKKYDFSTTNANIDRCYLRHPSMENYNWKNEGLTLYGTHQMLDAPVSPTFVGLRQRDFSFQMYADLSLDSGEGGISVYSCENEHYDIALRAREDGNGYEAVLKLNIGNIKHTQSVLPLSDNHARLLIKGDALTYNFSILQVTMLHIFCCFFIFRCNILTAI